MVATNLIKFVQFLLFRLQTLSESFQLLVGDGYSVLQLAVLSAPVRPLPQSAVEFFVLVRQLGDTLFIVGQLSAEFHFILCGDECL